MTTERGVRSFAVFAAIAALEHDTRVVRSLHEISELAEIPPERGGPYLTDWEREFIRDCDERIDAYRSDLGLSPRQQAKILEIASDLEKGRTAPHERDAGCANLFSGMDATKQAEQRARAARVKLPWEK